VLLGEESTLPSLSSGQEMKLKHLSIISMAAKCRVSHEKREREKEREGRGREGGKARKDLALL